MLVYKIAFITGLFYALTSLVLGQFLQDIDIDCDLPFLSIFPIAPSTIMIFITVFGGVGMLCKNYEVSHAMTIFISFIVAYIISFLVYRCIVRPLRHAQNSSAPSKEELIGLDANIKSCIIENGFGQISYTFEGNSYNSPAKHIGGGRIEKGVKVFIVDVKEHIFYVERKNFYYVQEDESEE